MKNASKTTFLLISFLFAITSLTAQVHKMERRDTSAVLRNYELNPVVVTGSGHHQRLKSTATPVHVLSRQEIKEQGISTFRRCADTHAAAGVYGAKLYGHVPTTKRTWKQIHTYTCQRSETLWRHIKQRRPDANKHVESEAYRSSRRCRFVALRL